MADATGDVELDSSEQPEVDEDTDESVDSPTDDEQDSDEGEQDDSDAGDDSAESDEDSDGEEPEESDDDESQRQQPNQQKPGRRERRLQKLANDNKQLRETLTGYSQQFKQALDQQRSMMETEFQKRDSTYQSSLQELKHQNELLQAQLKQFGDMKSEEKLSDSERFKLNLKREALEEARKEWESKYSGLEKKFSEREAKEQEARKKQAEEADLSALSQEAVRVTRDVMLPRLGDAGFKSLGFAAESFVLTASAAAHRSPATVAKEIGEFLDQYHELRKKQEVAATKKRLEATKKGGAIGNGGRSSPSATGAGGQRISKEELIEAGYVDQLGANRMAAEKDGYRKVFALRAKKAKGQGAQA